MNINQAKAIAGINYSVTGKAELSRAVLDCKNGIIAARRASNDTRAAQLSEAQAIFKKRAKAKSVCLECGATISRGAMRCRIHSRSLNKAIAAPLGLKPTEKRKGNGNARVDAISDPLALLGYYTPAVQKVVSKWRGIIGDYTVERCFVSVARAVLDHYPLELPPVLTTEIWQAVFELGAAIAGVCQDKKKIEAWILGKAVEGSYKDIQKSIIHQGGRRFETGAIAKRFKDLRLSVSKEVAKGYRQFVITKNG